MVGERGKEGGTGCWVGCHGAPCRVAVRADGPARAHGTARVHAYAHGTARVHAYADNFYLDMNGVIHKCARPLEGAPPLPMEAIVAGVLAYLDRLVSAIRPQQVLYIAVDGTAAPAAARAPRGGGFPTKASRPCTPHRSPRAQQAWRPAPR